MNKENPKNKKKFFFTTLLVLVGYAFLTVLFYFVCGEQLHYRNSRETIMQPLHNLGTIELVKDSKVEQTFISKMQIFEGFSVQMGTYGRINSGTLNILLQDLTTNEQLFYQTIPADTITEGMLLNFQLAVPREDLHSHQLLISLSSTDAVAGSAISPLMNSIEKREQMNLYFNGQSVEGMLCFSTVGRDYVWTGLHYWKIAAGGGLLLIVLMSVITIKYLSGKKSFILYSIYALKKYSFLINQLVSRDFKTKYKRSVLGILWSFLNPLLMMSVQYFVFSNLFKSDLPYYHVYLLIGIVMFNFFSESCGMLLTSVIGNTSLITKVYIPKFIYPFSRLLSSAINLLISLIPLFIVIILSGIPITKAYIMLLFVLSCLMVFCLGLGMLLSALMVFFRDIQFLWGVLSMMWMYATPIFYTESILPESFKFILKINPLYYFVTFMRTCILDGVSPEPIMYLQCALFAVGMLVIGAFVFKKSQDKFIFYI